jgi:hypothetical protein
MVMGGIVSLLFATFATGKVADQEGRGGPSILAEEGT